MAVPKYQLCSVVSNDIGIKAAGFIGFANRIEFMSQSVLEIRSQNVIIMNILYTPQKSHPRRPVSPPPPPPTSITTDFVISCSIRLVYTSHSSCIDNASLFNDFSLILKLKFVLTYLAIALSVYSALANNLCNIYTYSP